MMIPVYSLDALFGLIYPKYSLYVDGLREIYEAYVRILEFQRLVALPWLLLLGDLQLHEISAELFKPRNGLRDSLCIQAAGVPLLPALLDDPLEDGPRDRAQLQSKL